MKRFFALLLAAFALIMPAAALCGCIQHTHIVIASDSLGDFYCSIYEDGTIEIVRYIGDETIVKIPSAMGDRRVVGISTRAFINEDKIEEVYLPASITELPAKLFDNCSKLKSVYIPATVGSIGKDFVTDCPEFTTVLFGGTEQQWDSVSKGNVIIDNFALSTAEYRYEYVVEQNEP